MIMKRTKAALLGFAAAIALSLGLAGTAWAVADSEVVLTQQGNAVDVTINGTGSDVSAFSLVLDADVNADDPDAVQLGFNFSPAIIDNASIHEATFKPAGDKTRITLYVAGGHDLFAGSLYVGQITLGLDTEKSTGAEVTVEVPATEIPEAGVDGTVNPDDTGFYALRKVTSARMTEESGAYLTEPFTAYLGDRAQHPQPPQKPEEVTPPEEEYMGPDDQYAPKDDPYAYKPAVGDDLSRTGDTQMMVIGTLLAIAAVALCTMGVIVILKRRRS